MGCLYTLASYIYLYQCNELWVISCCFYSVAKLARFIYCGSYNYSTASYEYMSYNTNIRTSFITKNLLFTSLLAYFFFVSFIAIACLTHSVISKFMQFVSMSVLRAKGRLFVNKSTRLLDTWIHLISAISCL